MLTRDRSKSWLVRARSDARFREEQREQLKWLKWINFLVAVTGFLLVGVVCVKGLFWVQDGLDPGILFGAFLIAMGGSSIQDTRLRIELLDDIEEQAARLRS